MRFWDSSAIVPLLAEEPSTAHARALLDEDPEMVVWWATPTECASAFARSRRDGRIDDATEDAVLRLLRQLAEAWHEILPTDAVRTTAERLLRTHALRASDALQLAAAIAWAGQPRGDVLITYDDRLAGIARLEGFAVPAATSGHRTR